MDTVSGVLILIGVLALGWVVFILIIARLVYALRVSQAEHVRQDEIERYAATYDTGLVERPAFTDAARQA